VTPDVSLEYIAYLKNVYTHIISISYVDVNPTIFSKSDTRFRDVFTKLSCLKLIAYEKILLLDLDMIICKNIDHLFKLEPPAACIKYYNLKFGEKINPKLICNGTKLVGSINAGLILLKPDLNEWNGIKSDIKYNTLLYKFKYPEQDYLSLRYCHQWTSITFNYNFQFGLTRRVKQLNYKSDNIYVIHYSSSYKPWNNLVVGKIQSEEEIKFKKQHLKYYQLWNNIYDRIRIMYELKVD
jgi:lipopolysaccharide biosynthesis glycosyltransferase